MDGGRPQDEDRGAKEHVPWAGQTERAGPPGAEPAPLSREPYDHPRSEGGDDRSMPAKVKVMSPGRSRPEGEVPCRTVAVAVART